MKVYEGERGMDGVKVTANGIPLASRNDIRSFTRTALNGALLVRVHSS